MTFKVKHHYYLKLNFFETKGTGSFAGSKIVEDNETLYQIDGYEPDKVGMTDICTYAKKVFDKQTGGQYTHDYTTILKARKIYLNITKDQFDDCTG